MTIRFQMLGLVLLTGLGAIGCQYDHDTVLPGYYGQEGAKATTAPPPATGQSTQGINSGATAGSGAVGSSSQTSSSGGAQTSGSSQGGSTPASSGTQAGGSSSEGGMSTSNGTDTSTGTDTSSETGSSNGTDAQSGNGEDGSMMTQTETQPPGECDLTGRWLVTSHLTTDALGALQFGHYYEYFEITQSGDAFTVAKGFMCAVDAVGDGSLSADVDFSAVNSVLPLKVRYDGRKGTSTKVVDGCQIELDNWYTVRGATIPYYLDPANKLPTADEPATDTTPGWEDWDNDGNPGITGVLSGIVSGKIFVAPRVWAAMNGTVTDTSAFRLAVVWGQQQNMLGYDGSALLGTEAAIGPDPKTHFAQFVRLAPDQATGDELATCAAVISLAPQLTPEAAGS